MQLVSIGHERFCGASSGKMNQKTAYAQSNTLTVSAAANKSSPAAAGEPRMGKTAPEPSFLMSSVPARATLDGDDAMRMK